MMGKTNPDSPWPERDAELIDCWNWRDAENRAMSRGQIGQQMGITKPSVIGRSNKLIARGDIEKRSPDTILLDYIGLMGRFFKGQKVGKFTSRRPSSNSEPHKSAAAEIPRAGRTTLPTLPSLLLPLPEIRFE